MLGEAALTAEDAENYLKSYENALDAIGAASAGRGIYEGPGLSVKLSALHPRYVRGQRERVMRELYPRLAGLALRARRWDIGLNIDAEESERLDLSLDLLEALCRDPALEGWNGIGFVVQAYQKRAYPTLAMDHRSRARDKAPHHAAAGQGRLLGQRDQARAGRGPRGLRRLHAQGALRRFLYRLRQIAVVGARRGLPAICHA